MNMSFDFGKNRYVKKYPGVKTTKTLPKTISKDLSKGYQNERETDAINRSNAAIIMTL